jgi:hypothetical protein
VVAAGCEWGSCHTCGPSVQATPTPELHVEQHTPTHHTRNPHGTRHTAHMVWRKWPNSSSEPTIKRRYPLPAPDLRASKRFLHATRRNAVARFLGCTVAQLHSCTVAQLHRWLRGQWCVEAVPEVIWQAHWQQKTSACVSRERKTTSDEKWHPQCRLPVDSRCPTGRTRQQASASAPPARDSCSGCRCIALGVVRTCCVMCCHKWANEKHERKHQHESTN